MRRWIILIVALCSGSISAQTTPTPIPLAVIDADNVTQLNAVWAVDFTALPPDITVESGWFTLSAAGDAIAVVRREGGLVIYDDTGAVVDTFALQGANGQPATVLDARFAPDGRSIAAVQTDGEAFFVSVHTIGVAETLRLPFPVEYGLPVRVWFDAVAPYVWLEAMPFTEGAPQVVRLPLPDAEDTEIFALPNAVELDSEALVRIGRIPAPAAITATSAGVVKLWDLQTGLVTYRVQLESVPVFGRINEATGTQLAWRDAQSDALNILDFVTGESQAVAVLGGEYIQALLLGATGDVVLGVHLGDDPSVAAWLTATGEQLDFGRYRACSRVPDMVQLSADGTTLVIGCDTGLELWRVK
ncbi:MAG: hypothetical protein H7Y11_07990 [Armatimonadetes bacterium]|nr:hypothetical protein [Anaerolineae bacterium]